MQVNSLFTLLFYVIIFASMCLKYWYHSNI